MKGFVEAISRAKNRPHLLVAYDNAEFNKSEDPMRFYTNVHISVSNAQLCLRLLMMISCVVKKSVF